MRSTTAVRALLIACVVGLELASPAAGQVPVRDSTGSGTPEDAAAAPPARTAPRWSLHVQNTDIVQGDPAFPAAYSGANSLDDRGEVKDTISLDVLAGARLWSGAELHVDGLLWQGFGLTGTLGVEGFPNGEAFRLGTAVPNVNLARLFLRQTIGLGGGEESVSGDDLHLGGTAARTRLTFTLGRFSAKDLFDNNAYANDPRTQFMNWGLMANEAWDYPADSLGFITGLAVELHRPRWALRYGVFQMPRVSNGTALDWHLLNAWGMVSELERRYAMRRHPGTLRLLAYLNRAHMGSYRDAVQHALATGSPADITATRAYREKHGLGLNWDQALTSQIGIFSRLGWSDGRNTGK